jgi:SAM-dependent methyltransferase
MTSTRLKPLPTERRPGDPAAPAREGWSVEPFREGEPLDYARVRALLADAGYTEDAVLRRFGIAKLSDFKQLREGRVDDVPIGTPFEAIARLFLDSEAVELSRLRELLGDDGVAALDGLALLHAPSGMPEHRRATILLYPSQGLWIASDVNADPDGIDVPPPVDVVYPAITEGTQRFVELMPREPCDDFVELCSGTGIAALVAARDFARHAWAVDLTARSTRFARFNAALNALANVTALEGDLWAPLGDRTFDRVVAHPPYMPAFETLYVFRDGGADGEQVTRQIVAGLARHLRPGGTCFCSCMMTDRVHGPVERRLREMLGPAEGEFDVAVAQSRTYDPITFYAGQAREGKIEWASVARRQEAFEGMEITQLVLGSMLLRRRAADDAAAAPLTERRRMSDGTVAGDFAWLLDREARTRAAALAASPDGLRPRAGPGVQVRTEHEHVAAGWIAQDCQVVAVAPFTAQMYCPSWIAPLLMRCDGATSARALLDWLRAEGFAPADADEVHFAGMLLRLVDAGVLEVAAWPFPARPARAPA